MDLAQKNQVLLTIASLVFRISFFLGVCIEGVCYGPPLRPANLEPTRRGRGLACAYC